MPGLQPTGHARVSGRPLPLVVSTGPGAFMTLAPLMEAFTAFVPVVVIASQIDAEAIGKGRGHLHETPDQTASFAPLVKWTGRANSTAEIPVVLAEAWRRAATPPQGPVYVEVPFDVLHAPYGRGIRARAGRKPRARSSSVCRGARSRCQVACGRGAAARGRRRGSRTLRRHRRAARARRSARLACGDDVHRQGSVSGAESAFGRERVGRRSAPAADHRGRRRARGRLLARLRVHGQLPWLCRHPDSDRRSPGADRCERRCHRPRRRCEDHAAGAPRSDRGKRFTSRRGARGSSSRARRARPRRAERSPSGGAARDHRGRPPDRRGGSVGLDDSRVHGLLVPPCLRPAEIPLPGRLEHARVRLARRTRRCGRAAGNDKCLLWPGTAASSTA